MQPTKGDYFKRPERRIHRACPRGGEGRFPLLSTLWRFSDQKAQCRLLSTVPRRRELRLSATSQRRFVTKSRPRGVSGLFDSLQAFVAHRVRAGSWAELAGAPFASHRNRISLSRASTAGTLHHQVYSVALPPATRSHFSFSGPILSSAIATYGTIAFVATAWIRARLPDCSRAALLGDRVFTAFVLAQVLQGR